MLRPADGASGDLFGAAVAHAGNDLWVGAPTTRGYETGSVFVYEARDDGSLPAEPRRIRLPRAETVASDRFGGLIVADAGVVAAGRPACTTRRARSTSSSAATTAGRTRARS